MTSVLVAPDPPDPFEPLEIGLKAGTVTYRVHSNRYAPGEFNPGPAGSGRFHFFGDPMVPVLYSAETEAAAVAEVLLRNIPVTGGRLRYGAYGSKVLAALESQRDLRLASFLGTGLRALRVEPGQLTATPGEDSYPQTRKWAAAAHKAKFDGIVWMSRRNNSDRSYMFFGDRVNAEDFAVVPGSGRIFAVGADQDWLIDLCSPMHVDVMPGQIPH